MAKRLQVLLDEEELSEIQAVARRQRMTTSEWVRQVLRKAWSEHPRSVDAKLHAIADASRHRFPTADIDDMIREIEAGQKIP